MHLQRQSGLRYGSPPPLPGRAHWGYYGTSPTRPAAMSIRSSAHVAGSGGAVATDQGLICGSELPGSAASRRTGRNGCPRTDAYRHSGSGCDRGPNHGGGGRVGHAPVGQGVRPSFVCPGCIVRQFPLLCANFTDRLSPGAAESTFVTRRNRDSSERWRSWSRHLRHRVPGAYAAGRRSLQTGGSESTRCGRLPGSRL